LCHLLVFLVFASGFACAGHWIFGTKLVEFHSWPSSLATLLLTLRSGLPYTSMRQASEASASVFVVSWVVVMGMLLGNMFVGVLSCWFRLASLEHAEETAELAEKVSRTALEALTAGRFESLRRRCLRFLLGKCGGSRYDHDPYVGRHARKFAQVMDEALAALYKADLRNIDDLRASILANNTYYVADLAVYFGGDVHRAYEFEMAVRQLATCDAGKSKSSFQAGMQDFAAATDASGGEQEDSDGAPKARVDGGQEQEAENEKQELRKLQKMANRMSRQMAQLQEALVVTAEKAKAREIATRSRDKRSRGGDASSSNGSRAGLRPQVKQSSIPRQPSIPGTVPEGDA